jgi:hypothetical protein
MVINLLILRRYIIPKDWYLEWAAYNNITINSKKSVKNVTRPDTIDNTDLIDFNVHFVNEDIKSRYPSRVSMSSDRPQSPRLKEENADNYTQRVIKDDLEKWVDYLPISEKLFKCLEQKYG